MNNIFFYVIFTIMLLGLNIKADNVPCLPDCQNDQFTMDTYDLYLPLCNEVVEVDYGYRIACNIWYDYYIEEVHFNSSHCISTEFGGDLNLMLQYITEQFIIANPENFPPHNPSECELNWRVLKGSCWTAEVAVSMGSISKKANNSKNVKNKIQSIPNVIDRIKPCGPYVSDCCLEFYEVCINNEGDRIISLTGYKPPQNEDCGAPSLCVPVCGSVYNRD